MKCFTDKDRHIVQEFVEEMALADSRAVAGAIVGSFAKNTEDKWSDIDITFSIKSGTDTLQVLNDWTQRLDKDFGIVHHFDVKRQNAIYRVILFENCLELDLSVVPEEEYAALSPDFKLLYGKALQKTDEVKPDMNDLIGWGWHHSFHANAAINRNQLWRAEYWLSNLRNYIISLKCVRHELPWFHARGVDNLPIAEIKELEQSIIHSVEPAELKRVLKVLSAMLVKEIAHHDKLLANRLQELFEMNN